MTPRDDVTILEVRDDKKMGELVTAPGGSVYINAEQTSLCALFRRHDGTGRFFVLSIQRAHNLVRQTRSQARLVGINIEEPVVYVNSPTEIDELYRQFGRRSDQPEIDTQRYVIDLLNQAIFAGASDVRMDIYEDRSSMAVRFRVNTELTEPVDHVYRDRGIQIFNTIWEMADNVRGQWEPGSDQGARLLNNDELRSLGLDANLIACRLQFAKANDGYCLAIRLHTRDAVGQGKFTLDTLGLSEAHLIQLEAVREMPYGVLVVCGPTGSGKSTTLKNLLEAIDADCGGTKAIFTIEDPVEFPIAPARQLTVTHSADSDERVDALSAKIRVNLRLDPDVIMVHEIRDPASSQLAFQAAQTGHLVGTTVHANSALGAMHRLSDPAIGVPPGLLFNHSIVIGILAQRLVPKLCPHCCVPLGDVADDPRFSKVLRRIEVVAKALYGEGAVEILSQIRCRSDGCAKCLRRLEGNRSSRRCGVKGAVLVAEIILPDAQLMRHLRGGEGDEVEARKYLNTLRERGEDECGLPAAQSMMHHAWEKMIAGMIDPRDAEQVVGRFTAAGAAGCW